VAGHRPYVMADSRLPMPAGEEVDFPPEEPGRRL